MTSFSAARRLRLFALDDRLASSGRLAACLGFVLFCIGLYALRGFPPMAEHGADSHSYLALHPSRPPGYGLLLATLGVIDPRLTLLPALQLGALLAASGLLAFAIGLRLRSLIAALATLALLWVPEDLRYWSRTVMADPLFTACIMLILAAMVAPWRYGRAVAAAGIATGIAVTLRNVALALTLALVLHALVTARGETGMTRARWLAMALLPSVLALALSAGVHALNSGHATPGGWAGVSLLGKGLLLLNAESAASLAPALAGLAQEVAPAQEALAAVPGFRLSLRVQHDYHDYLRFVLAWDRLLLASAGDPATPGRIANEIAMRAIAADPAGYLHLVMRDWASLWAWPDDITAAERAADAASLAALPPLPYLTAYWQGRDPAFVILLPRPTLWPKVMIVRAIGAAAAIGGLAVIVIAVLRLKRRGMPVATPLLFAALAGQGMAASTALIEGGLSRYAMAIWPASVVLCVLGAHGVYSAAFGRASARTAAIAANNSSRL